MKNFITSILMLLAVTACNSKAPLQPTPVNPNATKEAVVLYRQLVTQINNGIMFGHQDDIVYGHSWKTDGVSDVKQTSNDFPAVFGWELGDLELGNAYSLDSVAFTEIEEGMKWVYKEGGINTVSWHVNNPLTGGNSWDVSSKEVVASILPNGEKHENFIEMLDKVSDFFMTLKDENGNLIPFIFRPYHEHTGSWFWWGQDLCSTDDYISLWRFTVNYFNAKGLNNILYAYSAAGNFSSSAEFLERYPGDDLIDIIGVDIYQTSIEGKENYITSTQNLLNILTSIAKEKNKVSILAETGFESIPDSTWWTETLWTAIKDYPISYVLLWRNAHDQPNHYYAPFPGQISADDFVAFKNQEKVLFLSDIKRNKESTFIETKN